MSEEQINKMVTRFLSWKLPKDFCPDAGISFSPTKPYEGDDLGNSWWPVGTNLLTAEQAREAIKHMLGDESACDCEAGQRDTVSRWFHYLWTKAGNATGYDKEIWRQARDQLVQAGIINS